ncbi:helix-turn-helix domain-containing protein [Halocatena pleomorpha]|uniref:helix-turn-helix domain-containing protein n=1 Tax=Halocatena pleomorpha TaxID=1785090 RepID=UPI00163A25FE|nr:helix-turn-helix domain-containing protein [Halocatena pleomorpha]
MSNRNGQGKYTPTVTDEEILASFVAADRPFQTATDISERFGLDRSQAYRRLQRLADTGSLEKSKIGSRAVVWWESKSTIDESSPDISGVNPDDEFWKYAGMFTSGPTDVAANVDKYLYGERRNEP